MVVALRVTLLVLSASSTMPLRLPGKLIAPTRAACRAGWPRCDADAGVEEPADASPPPSSAKEEKKALRAAIAELEAQLPAKRGELQAAQELRKDAGENGYMLLAANFERFRQQAVEEMKVQKSYGRVNTLRELLPFIESFEALQGPATEDDAGSAIHKYYGGIYKQAQKLIDDWQATPFEAAVGESYNWRLHEQVESVESEDAAAGVIIEARERGWMLGDEALRPAKVVVSRGPPQPEEEVPSAEGAVEAEAAAEGDSE
jgi:molecular chaperone GrpE (heat shock protein)